MTEILGLVGAMLPVGLAAALSTVPITVLLVLMLSPRRMSAAAPFVLGCALGTVLVVIAAFLLAQFLPDPHPRQAKAAIAALELLLGAALIALGARTWRHRRQATEGLQLPGWAKSAIDTVSGVRAFGLGVIIEFRPKSLLLACVVAVQVHASTSRDSGDLVVVLVYAAIATSTVTVPVLLTALSPQRMEPRLSAANQTLVNDGPLISALVLAMVGAVVIGSGLQDLA